MLVISEIYFRTRPFVCWRKTRTGVSRIDENFSSFYAWQTHDIGLFLDKPSELGRLFSHLSYVCWRKTRTSISRIDEKFSKSYAWQTHGKGQFLDKSSEFGCLFSHSSLHM